jgi:hypothetical protein
MKKRNVIALVLVATLSLAVQVYAHHSFAATYIEEKTMQIEGKLVEFQYKNPHSFIEMETTDQKGQAVRWSVEWAGSDQLRTEGVTITTLKYGDALTIVGNPGRETGDHRIRLISIRRPTDDFKWIGRN